MKALSSHIVLAAGFIFVFIFAVLFVNKKKQVPVMHNDGAIFDGQLLRFAVNEVLNTEDRRRGFLENQDGWMLDNPSDADVFRILKENGDLISSGDGNDLSKAIILHLSNSREVIQVWENGKVTVYSRSAP